ncbi:hypothetical protein [Sporomusa malonica]|uniref:Uncharacterized protein n=1 Tax=Sporomusa malonica TaxID=112901 RepID=A0A1W2BNH8_9FIRM|nr:hypothetical protein [Sporomusa malonica]SMC74252.1 hypothetical protein SAMN04488500_10812 [Sporomusa malonica]
MEKIVKQVTEWEFLQNLPLEMCGFTLINELMTCGSQYRIFTYNNQKARRSFTVLYDKATKDFLVRTVIGLTEFCDISFFTANIAALEKLLRERMEKTLCGLAQFDANCLCAQFASKKILEWPYALQLPKNLAGFELFITPQEPFKGLNGSYVIIDYSDFATESNLVVNYNIFRDQFFSEIRLRRTPIPTAEFDAKTLPELEGRLNDNLNPMLEKLRLKLQ